MKRILYLSLLFVTTFLYSQHRIAINANSIEVYNNTTGILTNSIKDLTSMAANPTGSSTQTIELFYQGAKITLLYDNIVTVSVSGGVYTAPISYNWLIDQFRTVAIVNQSGGVGDVTVFNEQKVALRTSQMNFKPTWGVTNFRYKRVVSGTGATAAETNGEFRMQTGTTAANISSIETNQRGQYQAGTMGQVGIGVRLPTTPTGTQYAKWGYSDFVNSGFYFGQDVTGIYVAYLTGGVETKTYQTNWNGDKLNGTGASGINLAISNGTISQIDFTWYGYGDIKFSFLVFNPATLRTQKIVIHTIKINNTASIIDPNQPLKFEVGNGASSNTDFSLFVGGHQFAVVAGTSDPQKRLISELLTNYTTALNTNWQPLIAFRKKATFNGRPNSVNGSLENFEVASDGEVETRITIGGTTSNLTFVNPTGILATETANETKITGVTALTTSLDGNPSDYGFVNANNKASGSYVGNVQIILGDNVEVILWVRRLSATGAIVIKHAHLTWKEEW